MSSTDDVVAPAVALKLAVPVAVVQLVVVRSIVVVVVTCRGCRRASRTGCDTAGGWGEFEHYRTYHPATQP